MVAQDRPGHYGGLLPPARMGGGPAYFAGPAGRGRGPSVRHRPAGGHGGPARPGPAPLRRGDRQRGAGRFGGDAGSVRQDLEDQLATKVFFSFSWFSNFSFSTSRSFSKLALAFFTC